MAKSAESSPTWRTKPTDRFVLRWIKVNLSARITPSLAGIKWIKPWMITASSSVLGTAAGLIYGLGWGWLAGLIAAVAQVLDGVDGQLARMTGNVSKAGAFMDSVLDRYADGAMVLGLTVYLLGLDILPVWTLILTGALAVIGSNAISYSTARAETLAIDLGRPTLASKGTRTAMMIVCAWLSPLWPPLPLVSLIYLAIHPNWVVLGRLKKAQAQNGADHD